MKFATVATTVVMMILGLTVPAQAEKPRPSQAAIGNQKLPWMRPQ